MLNDDKFLDDLLYVKHYGDTEQQDGGFFFGLFGSKEESESSEGGAKTKTEHKIYYVKSSTLNQHINELTNGKYTNLESVIKKLKTHTGPVKLSDSYEKVLRSMNAHELLHDKSKRKLSPKLTTKEKVTGNLSTAKTHITQTHSDISKSTSDKFSNLKSTTTGYLSTAKSNIEQTHADIKGNIGKKVIEMGQSLVKTGENIQKGGNFEGLPEDVDILLEISIGKDIYLQKVISKHESKKQSPKSDSHRKHSSKDSPKQHKPVHVEHTSVHVEHKPVHTPVHVEHKPVHTPVHVEHKPVHTPVHVEHKPVHTPVHVEHKPVHVKPIEKQSPKSDSQKHASTYAPTQTHPIQHDKSSIACKLTIKKWFVDNGVTTTASFNETLYKKLLNDIQKDGKPTEKIINECLKANGLFVPHTDSPKKQSPTHSKQLPTPNKNQSPKRSLPTTPTKVVNMIQVVGPTQQNPNEVRLPTLEIPKPAPTNNKSALVEQIQKGHQLKRASKISPDLHDKLNPFISNINRITLAPEEREYLEKMSDKPENELTNNLVTFTRDVIDVVLENKTGIDMALTICTGAVNNYMRSHYKNLMHNKYSDDTIIIMVILKRILNTSCQSSTIQKDEINEYYKSLGVVQKGGEIDNDMYEMKYNKYKYKYLKSKSNNK
jgi:hypothetical protein